MLPVSNNSPKVSGWGEEREGGGEGGAGEKEISLNLKSQLFGAML